MFQAIGDLHTLPKPLKREMLGIKTEWTNQSKKQQLVDLTELDHLWKVTQGCGCQCPLSSFLPSFLSSSLRKASGTLSSLHSFPEFFFLSRMCLKKILILKIYSFHCYDSFCADINKPALQKKPERKYTFSLFNLYIQWHSSIMNTVHGETFNEGCPFQPLTQYNPKI